MASGSQTGISSCANMPNVGLMMYIGISNGQTLLDYVPVTVTVLGAYGTLPDTLTNDDCSGNNGALCKFSVSAMKGAAAFDNFMGDASFPGWATAIRVFGSTRDFFHASPIDADITQDFVIDEQNSTIKNPLIHLKKDVMTYFRVATVDIAGNVGNFTSNANVLSADFGNCSSLNDNNPNDGCRYRYTPQNHK